MFVLPVALLMSAQRIVFADGGWASFDRGASCAAVARAQRVVADHSLQPQAGFTFDRGGPRHGQFAARLSHPVRPSSTVILTVGARPFLLAVVRDFAWSRGPGQEAAIHAAVRIELEMRIEARSPTGGRFIDSYSLDGAPGAIDAAAACAAKR